MNFEDFGYPSTQNTDDFEGNFYDFKPDSPDIAFNQIPQAQVPSGDFVFDFNLEPGFDDGYANHAQFMPLYDPKTTDHLTFMPMPAPAPAPVRGHMRSYTEPINRPPSIVKHSKEAVFQIRKNRKVPSNQPALTPPEPGSEDDIFQARCKDKTFTINPGELGFIPSKFWPNQRIPFGDVVADFFQRKNNVNCRFSHKLFNAIQIARLLPDLQSFTGVEWISADILKVNKNQFARLLGIHSIDGSLFHQQGNFSTHGFCEVSADEVRAKIGETEFNQMDLETVRLLKHGPGIFVRDVTEEQLDLCKWVSSRKKPEQ